MQRYRRLRRLQPDAELLRRRAAGATLRELARDYAVAHTTLGRYFARPEVAKQLRRAEQQLRAEQRAAEARSRAEQRATREAERRATQQAGEERRARLASHPEAERQPSRQARRVRPAPRPPRGGERAAARSCAPPARGRTRTGSTSAMPVCRRRRIRPVRLVSESGKTIAHTAESNGERMAAALEPRHGPLTVVPA